MQSFERQEPFVIDGREGEGGGQVLRTALALSILRHRPIVLEHIRGGRKKPGLKRQHMACVRAAAAVCGAEVHGNELNSSRLEFVPGSLQAGEHEFKVGSAGSVHLVLQTVLVPLLFAEAPSTLRIHGGTHNAWAPCFDFIVKSFLPQLSAMGAKVELELEHIGFFPAGGGCIRATVHPVVTPQPFTLLEAGERKSQEAVIRLAHLDSSIGDREWIALSKLLHWTSHDRVDVKHPESTGPGNCIHTIVEYERVTQVQTAFGARGRGAKQVGTEVAKATRRYAKSGAPVDCHLADQLLLPMAMLAGGSFRTAKPTEHTQTNARLINAFLGDCIEIEEDGPDVALIRVATSNRMA